VDIFLDQIKRTLATPIDVMDFVGFVEQFCDDVLEVYEGWTDAASAGDLEEVY